MKTIINVVLLVVLLDGMWNPPRFSKTYQQRVGSVSVTTKGIDTWSVVMHYVYASVCGVALVLLNT